MIDVSGDGANNQGPPVTIVRDQVLEKGITINGLPIMLKRPSAANMDLENLDIYYEDCVIGGAGSFVVPIREREKVQGSDPHQDGAWRLPGVSPRRALFRHRRPSRASPA